MDDNPATQDSKTLASYKQGERWIVLQKKHRSVSASRGFVESLCAKVAASGPDADAVRPKAS